MSRTLLLDSDIIAFKVAARNELVTAFGKAVGDLSECLSDVDTEIAELKRKLGGDDVIVCLTCPDHNFRLDVLPTYKHNRDYDPESRPTYLAAVKEHLEENYETYIRPHLEADDIMGILQTHPSLVSGETLIVSEDKDMRTVPGLVYSPGRSEVGIMDVSPLEAAQFHMWQTIVGDAVDGYTGAPRVGPSSVFAQAVLEEDGCDLWDTVLLAYGSVGLTEDHALQQARCAKILTYEWFDFKKKEVILWTP